jgi:hypothetical protein
MKHYDGEFILPVKPETAWRFLIDPYKVGHCIPDLMKLDVTEDRHFNVKVKVGVGPIRGAFDMSSRLSVEKPGVSAILSTKGGGMGSGVDMKSVLNLEPVNDGKVLLKWTSDVVVSGPIAALGGRLIDSQARKIIEQVFANISKAVVAFAENEKMEQAGAGDETADVVQGEAAAAQEDEP